MNIDIVKLTIEQFYERFEIEKRTIPYILATIEAETNYQLKTENMKYSRKRFTEVFKGKYEDALPYTNDSSRKSERKLANIVYANRNGNGERNTGDGWRFRGQGLIQLTGRRNYKKTNEVIKECMNIDFALEDNPSLLSTSLDVSVLSVLAYFKRVNINKCSNMDCVTRLVNPWIVAKEYTRRRDIYETVIKRVGYE